MEYVSGLLKDLVTGIAKDMLNANQHEIDKLNAQLWAMTDGDEATDLRTLKERKVNKGFAINRVLVHSGEYFVAYAEQTCMFDVRDAMVELTGILPRGAQQDEIINIARFYGREMHVLTALKRAGEVEPLTLTVLSTVWGRLKGMSGATFARLTTNLLADPPTMVEYNDRNGWWVEFHYETSDPLLGRTKIIVYVVCHVAGQLFFPGRRIRLRSDLPSIRCAGVGPFEP